VRGAEGEVAPYPLPLQLLFDAPAETAEIGRRRQAGTCVKDQQELSVAEQVPVFPFGNKGAFGTREATGEDEGAQTIAILLYAPPRRRFADEGSQRVWLNWVRRRIGLPKGHGRLCPHASLTTLDPSPASLPESSLMRSVPCRSLGA